MISPSVLFHEPKLCLLICFFSDNTPLMYSAIFGHLETCRLLVASKADVAARSRCRSPWRARNLPLTHSLRCSEGHTALQYAINNKRADVAAYLRSIGAPQ